MNYPLFTNPKRRVVLPQKGVASKGLLIPQAVVILDGARKLVTPKQYKDLGARPEAHCPCGVKIAFTNAHRVDGSFDVPDHFKTSKGHEHAPECGYHFRKAARDFEHGDHEYDLTKPYRIHLNFMDDEIKRASLTNGTGVFYGRDENGLPINETCKDWQPVSIKSMESLSSFVLGADPDRLKRSVVILNQQAVSWPEFCLSNRTPKRWVHLFNDITNDRHFLRLFWLNKKHPEQIDMFKNSSLYIPRDQIDFEERERSVILRPCLRASDETMAMFARSGVVMVLSIPDKLQRSIMRSKDRTLIADLPIPAQNPHHVGYVPSYPEFRAA